MNDEGFLRGLRYRIPVKTVKYDLTSKKPMLMIVDEVRGFCEVGCGPLAPPAPDADIDRMLVETGRLAFEFKKQSRPILDFNDYHEPGVPEPPYPLHCEIGSGQEEPMPELVWVHEYEHTLVIRKNCINGFVGGMMLGGRNEVVEFINKYGSDVLVVVGICTDICVLDFVCTMLSVRNRGIAGSIKPIPSLKDVVVYTPACATYDLPWKAAVKLGLPPEAAHPWGIMHHMGLKIMADRGAILAHELIF